jgi:hypothetical protein
METGMETPNNIAASDSRKHKNLIASQLRMTARWCRESGSDLYGDLLTQAAIDVINGGPCWSLLQGQENAPFGSALPLRFMGTIHRLVLEGKAPELANYYPSMGGEHQAEGLWEAFIDTIAQQQDALQLWLNHTVQTNEVGRCAGLIGGFLLLAEETGHPLRLLELGASAGLNLCWDQYFYQAGDISWGNPESQVRLDDNFTDSSPLRDVSVSVAERSGCDINPLDPDSEQDRLTLLSYVMADQMQRFELLSSALDIARHVPATNDKAGAMTWLGKKLEETHNGRTTVIYHSLVMQYLPKEELDQVMATIHEAGAHATKEAPLAWLRMEHSPRSDYDVDITLILWPGGEERLLASATNHGKRVSWADNT